jgi:hypothetical protein
LIRRSSDQFALHLAGVSFWSGAYVETVGWGVRALRTTLAPRIAPHVVRLVAKTLRHRGESSRRSIGPGVAFSEWDVPPPLIPYDRMYRR